MTKPHHSSKISVVCGTRGPSEWESIAIEARFRPKAVALICHVSSRTLQRHFKKSYGCTLREWLRNYRLDLAYQKLAAGTPIKWVAFDLGYKQISHFSRDFKQQYGCAPSLLERVIGS